MEIFDVYPLYPIEPVQANGCHFVDKTGTEYLDFYGGHAVISIGHSHPHYIDSIQQQLDRLAFYSNSIINPLQKKLAEKLGEASGYPDYQLFLVNSGAEAIENALKLASFATGKKGIVAFKKAFHGRTSAAVAVTDNPKIRAEVNPSGHVQFVALEDLDGVESILKKEQTCAVIIEGIQGISGINMPSTNFLRGLRALCTKYNTILILDEIQSGYGRTGKFFAHHFADIKPDVITMAKGMGNGFPIGGLIIGPSLRPKYGILGTTFGGNHLACSAAIAVLEVIERENLIENAEIQGKSLVKHLAKIDQVQEIKGRGLMLGLKFEFEVKKLRKHLLLEEKIFVGSSSDPTILRLLPPLCIGDQEVEQLVTGLTKSLKNEKLLIH